MTTKNSIKYASIDTHHLKNIETKKSSRKSGGGSGESKLIAISEKSCLSATTKNNRRSQSLDRLDENSGDSRAERRNRRQYMHLISEKNEQIEQLIKRVTTLQTLNNEFATEHKRYEHEIHMLQQRCDEYEHDREMGCDSCRILAEQNADYQSEIDGMSTENQQLSNDIGMMKVLIYRLNVQLENYQEMLRKLNRDENTSSIHRVNVGNLATTIPSSMMATTATTPITAQTNFENIESIDWGCVQSHVLAPLLNAYQETIKEKNGLVKQYENELNQMTGRIKDILSENEKLHEQIDDLKQANDTWQAEKVRLQAQLDVCRNKAEIHSKRADLAKEKLMEVMRCYEKKLQSQSIDIQRLQDSHSRLRNEQTNCQTMHQQPELVVESLKERQRLFDEAKVQYESEKTKLIDEMLATKEAAQKTNAECHNLKLKIAEQKLTIDSQSDKLGCYHKKMEKLRTKFLRLQQSRDTIRNRLRTALTWNRKIEVAAKTISWPNLHKIEQLLQQKETQLQQLRIQYRNDVDKLQRKLHRRDEILRKILLNKVKRKNH